MPGGMFAFVLMFGVSAWIGSSPKPTYATKPSRGGDGYSPPKETGPKQPAGKSGVGYYP